MTGLDLSDFSLTYDGVPVPLSGATLTGFGSSYTLGNLTGLTGRNGRYALTLKAQNSGIADAFGNPLSFDAVGTWVANTRVLTAILQSQSSSPRPMPLFSLPIYLSSPGGATGVTGFDLTDLSLTRDGVPISLASSTLTDSGNGLFVLGNLYSMTQASGCYTLTLRSQNSGIVDSLGNSLRSDAVGVFVRDAAPSAVALSRTTIAENNLPGAVVGTFSTTDADAGDEFTYSLVSGTGSDDNAAFTINGNNLAAVNAFSFKTKSTYTILVRATDAAGLYREQAFTVSVTNVNEAPTDITLSAHTITENLPVGAVVGMISTSDPDAGDAFTYTLVNGTGSTDNAAFMLVGNTLKTAAVVDFETKSSYWVRVRTTDAGGLFTEKPFMISVTNVNEAPTITSSPTVSVAENQTAVQTVTATDADAGTTLNYSIVGGADQSLFAINASTGVLTFKSAPNYESPTDVGANNVYNVTVQASDGTLVATKAVAVTVTNVNENPSELQLTATSIAENLPIGAVVGTLSTIDADAGDTFTYSLYPGLDSSGNSSFTIEGNQLKAAVVFNYMIQKTYSINVLCVDSGGLSVGKILTVSVVPNNKQPNALVPASFAVVEDVASNLVFPGKPFSDDSATLTVTLSVAEGVIAATNGGNVTVGGTPTARTFAGSVSDLNAFFATAGKITYQPASNSTTSRSLTVSTFDGQFTTAFATDIVVTPSNDAPVASGTATLAPVSVVTPTASITGATVSSVTRTSRASRTSPSGTRSRRTSLPFCSTRFVSGSGFLGSA